MRIRFLTSFTVAACAACATLTSNVALAQSSRPSICYNVAENLRGPEFPTIRYVSFSAHKVASPLSKYNVTISYQGHSTYLIESPNGVKIATDYAGYMVANIVPDVVTMNQAHTSHYTSSPDPKIAHVLPGWNDDATPAEHYVSVDDVLIRNVTTDLLRFASVPDGNSIFIFEVAGLCIGHLGHLHHKLTDDHFASIGRLDIVMVPVDGGLTLAHKSVRELLDRLRSSVVLPMHVRFAGALPQFLAHLGDGIAVVRHKENKLILSLRNLPKQPTVILLPGVSSYPEYE